MSWTSYKKEGASLLFWRLRWVLGELFCYTVGVVKLFVYKYIHTKALIQYIVVFLINMQGLGIWQIAGEFPQGIWCRNIWEKVRGDYAWSNSVVCFSTNFLWKEQSLQILDAGLWDAASWEYRFLEILRYNLMGEGVSKSSLLQHCYTV